MLPHHRSLTALRLVVSRAPSVCESLCCPRVDACVRVSTSPSVLLHSFAVTASLECRSSHSDTPTAVHPSAHMILRIPFLPYHYAHAITSVPMPNASAPMLFSQCHFARVVTAMPLLVPAPHAIISMPVLPCQYSCATTAPMPSL